MRLDELCDGKPAYYLGEELRAEGVEPNWREARALASDLMQRSADLGVLVRLAAACLREGTLAEFTDCVEVLTTLVETYWTECYPELDVDDDGTTDASVRLGVLSRFEDDKLILAPLRGVRVTCAEAAGGHVQVSALAGSSFSASATGEAIEMLERLVELSDRIDRAVAAQSPEDADFSTYRFRETCTTLRKNLVAAPQADSGVSSSTPLAAVRQSAAVDLEGLAVGMQPARGRELAVAQIRTVIRYFEAAEPSSPVIGVLERAIDLIGKDFWSVMSQLGEQRLLDAMGETRLFVRK